MQKARQRFSRISNGKTAIIGMITLGGLDYDYATKRALSEAEVFIDAGCEAILVTNYCKNAPAARVLHAMAAIKQEYSGNGVKIGAGIFPNNMRRALSLARGFDLDFFYFDYVSGVYTKGPDFDSNLYSEFMREHPGVVIFGGVHPYGYIPVSGTDIESDLREGMRRSDALVVSSDKDSLTEKVKNFSYIIGRNSDSRSERYPLVIFDPALNTSDGLVASNMAEGVILGPNVRNNSDPEAGINISRLRGYARLAAI